MKTTYKGWLVDPTQFGLGCGSHSCKYVKPTGMAVNGPCHCSSNHGKSVEMFLNRNYAVAMAKIKELELALSIEEELKG